MSDDTSVSESESPRADLGAHLKQLEQFVEESTASGADVPPEAAEMISRLREIMLALDGLASSMGDTKPAGTP